MCSCIQDLYPLHGYIYTYKTRFQKKWTHENDQEFQTLDEHMNSNISVQTHLFQLKDFQIENQKVWKVLEQLLLPYVAIQLI